MDTKKFCSLTRKVRAGLYFDGLIEVDGSVVILFIFLLVFYLSVLKQRVGSIDIGLINNFYKLNVNENILKEEK